MPGQLAPQVDVVVATYGNPDLLANCLRALRQMSFRDYRLIVVDDGSPEPVLPIVKAVHPGATVLRSERNGGLVRALNRGIRHGRTPLVALLNDDTEVSKGWLESLVAASRRLPDAGSFASKLVLYDDPPRFHSAGDGFGVWGMPFNRGVWLDDLEQYDVEEPVFGACAGAALYRRSALQDVALPDGSILDPRLFMYLEDVDLSWRLQRAGHGCVYVPDATVRHHLSATGGGSLASYYVSRNIWPMLFRSVPRQILRRYWRIILTYHLRRNMNHMRHIRSPQARASLRGTLAGLGIAIRGFHSSTGVEDGPQNYPLEELPPATPGTPRQV